MYVITGNIHVVHSFMKKIKKLIIEIIWKKLLY